MYITPTHSQSLQGTTTLTGKMSVLSPRTRPLSVVTDLDMNLKENSSPVTSVDDMNSQKENAPPPQIVGESGVGVKKRCGLDLLALVACTENGMSPLKRLKGNSYPELGSPLRPVLGAKENTPNNSMMMSADHPALAYMKQSSAERLPSSLLERTKPPPAKKKSAGHFMRQDPEPERKYYVCYAPGCGKAYASHKARELHCVKTHTAEARSYLNDLHYDINEVMGLPKYMNRQTKYKEEVYLEIMNDLPGKQFFPVDVELTDTSYTVTLSTKVRNRARALKYLEVHRLRSHIVGKVYDISRVDLSRKKRPSDESENGGAE